jgi:hypothetical protein
MRAIRDITESLATTISEPALKAECSAFSRTVDGAGFLIHFAFLAEWMQKHEAGSPAETVNRP